MKILHTSDLHLGAKIENLLQIDQQQAILDEIVKIANENQIDVVAIAGDVFHTATPSAQAEDLFYNFLENLTKNNDRVVLVIAGNHDDPKRLQAVEPLAKRHNIVLCCDLAPLPNFLQGGNICIEQSGRGFVRIKKGEEKIDIALLPYPAKSRIEPTLESGDPATSDSYLENVENWCKICTKNFDRSHFCALFSHLYLVGATDQRNGTKVRVGDSLALPTSVLPDCDYVGVGHLHSMQLVDGTKNTYYSGAIMKMRLYDSAPQVLIVDTLSKEVLPIKLCSPVDIKEIRANSIEDATQKILAQNKSDILYLTFENVGNLTSQDVKKLRDIHPNIVSIRFENQTTAQENKTSTKNLSPEKIFECFYKFKKGEAPSNELVEAFLKLLEETDETADS